jgi:protein TonB
MPRDLFGDVVHHGVRVGGRAWYGLPLTVLVHAIVIAAAVIVPLTAIDELPVLPRAAAEYMVIAPPEPPPAPPRAPRRAAVDVPAVNPHAAPLVAPAGIAPDTGLVPDPEPSADAGVPGGIPGSIDGAGLGVQPEAPPPPPQPVTPVRITSDLRRPAKIRDVMPVYPDIAMRARVAGMVVLEATIDAQGKVVNLRVLRSVPLLDQAAIDAVRQWEFTPTRLNGVAVPVVMTVTVNFTLR